MDSMLPVRYLNGRFVHAKWSLFLDPSFRARGMLTYGLYAASPLLNGRFVHAKWFLLDPSFRAREMLICEAMLPVVS